MFTIEIKTINGWTLYDMRNDLSDAMDAWRLANRKGHTARIVNVKGNTIHG